MINNLSKLLKFFFLIVILLTTSNFCFSQILLRGKITNQKGVAVNGASVAFAKNQIVLQQTVSDGAGNFSVMSKDTGSFTIKVRHTSYKEYVKTILMISTQPISLNVILMPDTTALKEVTIVAKKDLIEQKIDRTVFNVENSVALNGANVLDALSKLPGVRVKSGSGLALAGKGQVNVLINDRIVQISGEDLLNYLRSMSVSEISKIEIITNPPANYDAQGNFGLINIVTKKKRDAGFNGSVFSTYTKSQYNSGTLGTVLNYNQGKFNINTSVNLTDNNTKEQINSITAYPEQNWNLTRTGKNHNEGILARITLDYQISKKKLLVINYVYSDRKLPVDDRANTIVSDVSGNVDSTIIASNQIDKHSITNTLNLHYEQSLDTAGKKFTIDAGIFTFNSTIDQFSNNATYLNTSDVLSSSLQLSSSSPLNVKAYTSQIDFYLPNKWFKFSAGGKISFIPSKTVSNYYDIEDNTKIYNPQLSNAFNYNENLQAVYLNASKKLGRWETQLGLRAEYTETTGNSLTTGQITYNNYLKLFPSFFLTYKPNSDNNWSFSYGRRINRPSYWYLNPFKQFVSPYFYYEGNPFLRPSFSNNFQLNYIYKGRFTTRVWANLLSNVFDQITIPDSVTKVSRLTRLNYYSQQNFGISQTVAINQSWFESYNTISGYYITTHSYISIATGQNGFSGDFTSNNVFIFNKAKTLLANLDFSVNSPQVSGIAHFKGYYSLDAGFKTLLNRKNLSLGINATDILKTARGKFYWTTNDIRTTFDNYFDARTVRVSVNYRFGKGSKTRQQIKDSNQEESRRAN